MKLSQVVEKLQRLRDGAKEFSVASPEFENWRFSVKKALKSGGPLTQEELDAFRDISFCHRTEMVAGVRKSWDNSGRKASFRNLESPEDGFSRGMNRALHLLDSAIEHLGFQEGDRTSPPAVKLQLILKRFHVFCRQLRVRHDNRPTLDVRDEYDMQNALHALLTVVFDDVRAEDVVPMYAGGTSRIDFILKDEEIGIECKMMRKSLSEKKLGEELMIDITRYSAYPSCKTLMCFVYDPMGRIGNPKGLIRDLEALSKPELAVRVLVTPT